MFRSDWWSWTTRMLARYSMVQCDWWCTCHYANTPIIWLHISPINCHAVPSGKQFKNKIGTQKMLCILYFLFRFWGFHLMHIPCRLTILRLTGWTLLSIRLLRCKNLEIKCTNVHCFVTFSVDCNGVGIRIRDFRTQKRTRCPRTLCLLLCCVCYDAIDIHREYTTKCCHQVLCSLI